MAGAEDLSTKGCTAIKIADAQALVKAVVTKIEFTPGDAELDPHHQFRCEFSDQAMLITINPEDSSEAVYKEDVADENVSAKPLPGVGDVAVWAGVILAKLVTSAPDVIAHKGAVTCRVETAGGPGLTIPIDPGPIGGSTVTAAVAYAGKMGALCNDIFGALT